MKYIDSIEIEKVKDEIVIKKININKKEIMNIGYMFRNDCFDILLLLSNSPRFNLSFSIVTGDIL